MKGKTKIIVTVCALILLFIGATVFFLTTSNKLDKTEDKVENLKDKVEEKIDVNDKEDIKDTTKSENDNTTIAPTTENNIANSSSNNTTKPASQEKPSVPEEPSTPEEPSEEDPVIETLILTADMLENNELVVKDKVYSDIMIEPDIPEYAHIVIDNVEIENVLAIGINKKFQLDIMDSSLQAIETYNSASYSLFSARDDLSINRVLDGPTINLVNCSDISTVTISGNMEINSDQKMEYIVINDGKEVVVNAEALNLYVIEGYTDGIIVANKAIDMVENNGSNIKFVSNANIGEFYNDNKDNNIMINNATIDSFINTGLNTTISGNGTVDQLEVYKENTVVYANVNEKHISDGITNVAIRPQATTSITYVKSEKQGSVSFTLSEEITGLTLDDISVICHAGKSISLFSEPQTTDNKNFTISTSYLKSNTYSLYITLPNGSIISADFTPSYDKPQATSTKATRTSADTANLELYGIDEGGYLYFILEPISAYSLNTKESIKENGIKVPVKVGYNLININSLVEGESYNLYYTIEGFYNNQSDVVGPITIDSNVLEGEFGEYKIVYAKEEIINRFAFKLNKPVEQELTLDDFVIICPTGSPLTLSGATLTVSPDGLIYIITIPNNYGHLDNKYTVQININGKTISKDFIVNFNPPTISGEQVTRIDENTVSLTFNSDKAGTVYYGVYEWNGGIYDYNSTTPFATDVLTGKIPSLSQPLKSHEKGELILSNVNVTNNTRIWALFVDENGNYRRGFVDHYGNIPEYVKPEENIPVATLNITGVTASNQSISVTFSEDVGYVGNSDFSVKVVKADTLPKLLFSSSYDNKTKTFNTDILNYSLNGTYKIVFNLTDSNGKLVTVEKEFTV